MRGPMVERENFLAVHRLCICSDQTAPWPQLTVPVYGQKFPGSKPIPAAPASISAGSLPAALRFR